MALKLSSLIPLVLLFSTIAPAFAQDKKTEKKPAIFITRTAKPDDELAKKLISAVEDELGDDMEVTEIPSDGDMPEGFGAAFVIVQVDDKTDVVVMETINDEDQIVQHVSLMAGKYTEEQISKAADVLVGEIETQYVATASKKKTGLIL